MVMNLNFVKGLRPKPRPYPTEAELADDRVAEALGVVDVLVEICGMP